MKPNLLRGWLWTVTLALVIPAGAQALAAEAATSDGLPPLPPNFTKRTLALRVLDAQDGTPVPEVRVENSTWYVLVSQGTDFASLPKPHTDDKGEVQVVLLVPPAEATKQMTDLSLSVEHTNYASRTISWHVDGGGVFGSVPDQYTVRIQRGTKIGGTVIDDQGHPLADARVLVSAYGNNGYSRGESKVQEFSSYNTRPFDPAGKGGVVTDAAGRWSISNFPPDLEGMRITVIRNDGSDINYSSQSERFSPSRRDQPLAVTELRNQTAVFKLPSGFTVKGRILGPEGQPVAGAKITDAYGMNLQARGQVTSDADGRFQFDNRRERQCVWAVEAPGYALASEVINLKADLPEQTIRLERARPAVLRIVDADGKPAAGILVQAPQWRNEAMFVNFSGHTGADGTLAWTNAPTRAVRALISSPSEGMRYVSMQSGKEETVTLNKKPREEVQIKVKVTDAKTKQALASFEVQMDREFGERFVPWIQGADGVAQGTIKQSEFRSGMYPQFRLRASASGYIPKASEQIDYNDGDQERALALDPDVPIKGVVHLPDGSAGDGVYFMVSRQPGPIFLNQTFQRGPAKPPSWGNMVKVQAATDGAYVLEGIDANAVVVAIHEDGYAEVPIKELRANPNLTLHPWEKLDGVLKIGPETAKAGQRIGLTTMGSRAGAMGIHFDATTDAEGRFAFDRIPAAPYMLFRYMDNRMGTIIFSHRYDVEVKPGVPEHVEMGGKGMRLEGRVRPSGYADLDWTANRHTLTAKASAVPTMGNGPDWEDYVRRADFEAITRGRVNSPAPDRQYTLTFDKDGSFFVDDVPPGEYVLQVKVTEPPPRERYWMDDGKLIGMLSTNLVVQAPEGGPVATMKIGPFVLPVASVTSGAPMPLVQARSLDGKAVELGGKKTAPQAILFWAPWSEKSRAALTQFSQSTAAVQSGQIDAIAVALDDDPGVISKSAESAAWKGTLAKLAGPDLLKALAIQPVEELPLLLIVDRNGQLITKTSNVARLNDALTEAINSSSNKP